jgi:hypothetical protein
MALTYVSRHRTIAVKVPQQADVTPKAEASAVGPAITGRTMTELIAAHGTVTRGLRRSGFDAIMIAHGRRFSSCLPRRSALPRQNCSRIMTVASPELLPQREPGGGRDEAGQHGDEGRVACSDE